MKINPLNLKKFLKKNTYSQSRLSLNKERLIFLDRTISQALKGLVQETSYSKLLSTHTKSMKLVK